MWLRPWLPGIATFALTIGGVTGCLALSIDDGAPPRRLLEPRAVDGDSVAFRVRVEGSSIVDQARAGFVDAPEADSRACGAAEAAAFTQGWLSGREEIRTPQIGRERTHGSGAPVVRIVGTDEADLGLALVRAGWGRLVDHPGLTGDARAYAGELRAAETEARAVRSGAWAACP